jgi:hypothetical protein
MTDLKKKEHPPHRLHAQVVKWTQTYTGVDSPCVEVKLLYDQMRSVHAAVECKYLYYDYYGNICDTLILTRTNPAVRVLALEYVDNGVKSWAEFARYIKNAYPNLDVLIMAQNFSSASDSFADFASQFGILYLIDCQTLAFDSMNWSTVMSQQSKGSVVVIRHGLNSKTYNAYTMVDAKVLYVLPELL